MKMLWCILYCGILLCPEIFCTPTLPSSKLEYINFKRSFSNKIKRAKKKPLILSVCSLGGQGGMEVSCFWLHKALMQAGYEPVILVRRNTPLQNMLMQNKISHYVTNAGNSIPLEALIGDIRTICVKEKITLAQAHIQPDLLFIAHAVPGLKTKIVYIHHGYYQPKIKNLKNITGIIAVNNEVLDIIKHTVQKTYKETKHFLHLYPFFDEKKFITYTPPSLSRQEFLTTLGINNHQDLPIICMIGNFYSPEIKPHELFTFEKNQELLLRALHNLVYKCNRPCHVIFAGSGPSKAWHEALSAELKLDSYAHFLGYCNNTRNLLHFSDFHILSSTHESCGIAHLEAGLMKKASLGATQTGATSIIIHGKTGFIFKNNDLDDLISKIEFLLDHPSSCKQMGLNAYDFITGNTKIKNLPAHFLTKFKMKQLQNFYHKVMTTQPNKVNPVISNKKVYLADLVQAHQNFTPNYVENYFK